MAAEIERLDRRISFWLCAIAATGLLPFVMQHLLRQNWYMFLSTGSLALVAVAVAIEARRKRAISQASLTAAAIVGDIVTAMATYHLQLPGLYWAYPMVAFNYYMTGPRTGTVINVLFVAAVLTMASQWANAELYPRMIATLSFSVLFSFVFAYNIDRNLARQAQELKRKEQEHELARAARLSTMGEMASALAHELNQPLACARNYLHGLEERAQDAPPDAQELEQGIALSLRQIERAEGVIRHVRNFTRHHTPQTRPTDLNRLILEMVSFVDFEIRRHQVRLDLQLARPLPPVLADELEIEQVLLNLFRNAIEAMKTIPPTERVLAITSAARREGVEVSVRDAGPGLAPEVAERVFEPFFTTKCDGTGLGLAICRTLVHSHGGEIGFRPQPPGQGAWVSFSLPSQGGT